MKGNFKHLAMCAPMLVLAVILVASGVGIVSLLPLIGCMLMMWLMMRGMGHGRDHSHPQVKGDSVP